MDHNFSTGRSLSFDECIILVGLGDYFSGPEVLSLMLVRISSVIPVAWAPAPWWLRHSMLGKHLAGLFLIWPPGDCGHRRLRGKSRNLTVPPSAPTSFRGWRGLIFVIGAVDLYYSVDFFFFYSVNPDELSLIFSPWHNSAVARFTHWAHSLSFASVHHPDW